MAMDKPSEEVIERFEANIFPEPMSGCWLWMGPISDKGYGRFRINGRAVQAHRFWKERELGREIPKELQACHHCDVPCCVNPRHIFEGTCSENHLDAIKKGRVIMPKLYGDSNHKTKLSQSDVREIRNCIVNKTISETRLAARYGVVRSTIWNIKIRKTWSELQ